MTEKLTEILNYTLIKLSQHQLRVVYQSEESCEIYLINGVQVLSCYNSQWNAKHIKLITKDCDMRMEIIFFFLNIKCEAALENPSC